jgi:hypothetical protein
VVGLCLAGFVAAIRVTSLLDMAMLRNTFVTSLARFTNLHAPASMEPKSAKAFRALLFVADDIGNHLHVRCCPYSSLRLRQMFIDPFLCQRKSYGQYDRCCAAIISQASGRHREHKSLRVRVPQARPALAAEAAGRIACVRSWCRSSGRNQPACKIKPVCNHCLWQACGNHEAAHRARTTRPQEVWPEVLRCISRFDLVGQGRSEASLFAAAAGSSAEQASPTGIRASLRRGFFSGGRPGKADGVD